MLLASYIPKCTHYHLARRGRSMAARGTNKLVVSPVTAVIFEAELFYLAAVA